ncbi:MAG: hypothetical protein AAF958_12655, partial [Planctomycetota bacterium]
PTGITRRALQQFASQYGLPTSGPQFQAFARFLDVEAVVVGSVTDFDMYYPPRMAMTTHWYAADETFHAIPAGYGLPWGTDAEKKLPRRIVREAEFELARAQLATQIPAGKPVFVPSENPLPGETLGQPSAILPASASAGISEHPSPSSPLQTATVAPIPANRDPANLGPANLGHEIPRPAGWPNVTDLIPDPPAPVPPPRSVNHEPILSHTRIYEGNDPYLTNRLADWVDTGDDARPDGWQGYLRRTDDFVHFCCHLHITEMLESRGGRDQSDLILRWQLSRY